MSTTMSSPCMYGSKPCSNQRSLKENGDLHRLCDFHRERANAAQRRWHKRQRCDTPLEVPRTTAAVGSPTKKQKARAVVTIDSKTVDVNAVARISISTKQETPLTPTYGSPSAAFSALSLEPTSFNEPLADLSDDDMELLGELMLAIDAPPLSQFHTQQALDELFKLESFECQVHDINMMTM